MFPTNSIVAFWHFCAIKARNRALKFLENDSVSLSKRQLWQRFLVQKVPTFYAIVDNKFVLIVAGYTMTTFIKFIDIILNLNFFDSAIMC
jgi:thioredoxin-related protein